MEEKKINFWKHSINWGVILGIASIIFSLLIYLLDFKPTTFKNIGIIFFLSVVLLVVILRQTMKSFRVNILDGTMSFGQAFKVGFFAILIGVAISTVYSYVFYQFIDPDYLKNVTEEFKLFMEDFYLNMGMTEEQIEANMEASNGAVPTPIMQVIGDFFSGIIFYTIINLIVAAIMKKKAETPFS